MKAARSHFTRSISPSMTESSISRKGHLRPKNAIKRKDFFVKNEKTRKAPREVRGSSQWPTSAVARMHINMDFITKLRDMREATSGSDEQSPGLWNNPNRERFIAI